jgi:hypothetical protein
MEHLGSSREKVPPRRHDDLQLASRPQLPALCRRSDRVGERDVDAEHRTGVAGRPVPGPARTGRPGRGDHHGTSVPPHARARGLGRARGRPGGQTAASVCHTGLGGDPRARARPARFGRTRPSGGGSSVGGLPARAAPGSGECLRQPRAPELRRRDGGKGRPGKRCELEQHRHERRACRRACPFGAPHRNRRPGGLLRGERGELPGRDRGACPHAASRPAPHRAFGEGQRPVARGPRLRVANAEAARAAVAGVRGGSSHLQLQRDPPAVRSADVPRRRGDVLGADLPHGWRRSGRRAGGGEPRQS